MFAFDFISLIYLLYGLRSLWRLRQNWRGFWDDEITYEDRRLASELAFSILIPIGVFLHEAGHAVAVWFFGGVVVDFQWHVFWGYVVPSGSFSIAQFWWISLSGNLVSILIGLLPIPLVFTARRRIYGELIYAFVRQELFYSLVWYPVLSFAGFGGDWVTIYDFSISPYAHITLALHIGLLFGVRRLDNSPRAARWRIARRKKSLSELKQLESRGYISEVEKLASLAFLYHKYGEHIVSQSYLRRAKKLRADDGYIKYIEGLMAYSRGDYHLVPKFISAALKGNLKKERHIDAYATMAHSYLQSENFQEASSNIDRALALSPEDHNLLFLSADIKWKLGHNDKAQVDYDKAVSLTPDDER